MTNFKYALLRLMRNKANLFWILVFPILLGCLFKIAFSNITASENFHTIPVAVVEGDSADVLLFPHDDRAAFRRLGRCDAYRYLL